MRVQLRVHHAARMTRFANVKPVFWTFQHIWRVFSNGCPCLIVPTARYICIALSVAGCVFTAALSLQRWYAKELALGVALAKHAER